MNLKYYVSIVGLLSLLAQANNSSIDCITTPQPHDTSTHIIPLNEYVDACSQIVAHLAGIALAPENPVLVSSHLAALTHALSQFVQKIHQRYGLTYGLIPYLMRIMPHIHKSRPPINAMAEIDDIIKQSHHDQDKVAAFVLMQFSTIVGNFAHIVGNPHNPDVVAAQVTNIFAGLVNIAKEAITHQRSPLFLDRHKDELAQLLLQEATLLHASS